MRRIATILLGLLRTLVSLATFVYLAGFVAGVGTPTTVDAGCFTSGFWAALPIDMALVALFGIQHAVMARPGSRPGPAPSHVRLLRRTLFELAACACLALLFWQWRAMPAVVWSLTGRAADGVGAIALAGWVLVFVGAVCIDPGTLLGEGRVRVGPPRGLRVTLAGFLLAFWAAPTMTVGHLFFALSLTGYIAGALVLGERDPGAGEAPQAAHADTRFG